MDIIFCGSYLSVPLAISIAEESKNDFLFVVFLDELEAFFADLYGKNRVKKLKPLTYNFSPKFFINAFLVTKAKIECLRYFSRFKNDRIYFFFVAYCYFESWLIKKLSSRNEVYYIPVVKLEKKSNKIPLIAHINRVFINLLYGIEVRPLWMDKKLLLYCVSDSFLKRVFAQHIGIEIKNNVIESKISEHYISGSYDILLLAGGIVESNLVTEAEYISGMGKVISVLKNEGVVLKMHPRFNKKYFDEKHLPEIPSFIPANLMLRKFKVVIGYSSAAIFEAANMDVCAISLLNFIEPVSQAQKESFLGYLQNNTGKGKRIFYPENENEIKNIIQSVLKSV